MYSYARPQHSFSIFYTVKLELKFKTKRHQLYECHYQLLKKTKDQSKKLHHVEDLAMDIIIL